jgi:hypothetical protein
MADRARKDGRPQKMSRSDTRVLLRAITENPRAFRDPLSRLELAYAREIAEVANQWAHLEPFSEADTGRALDTIMRFLSAADAEAEAGHVAEMLLGAPPDVPAEAEPRGQEGGSADLRSSATAPSASHDSRDAPDTSSEEGGAVAEFRDRDGDYLAWVAAHGSGFVINIGRSGRGAAMLHRAGCGTITSRPPFTDSYMKVCSPSPGPLDAWALQRNGSLAQRCGICRPPAGRMAAAEIAPRQPAHAAPAALPVQGGAHVSTRPGLSHETAQKARTSKYDPLRDFLAGKGGVPVTLTFAQIDLLVGTLPRSARLYHLWWRDDDPSHPHCRSWNDAGYIAHPDFSAQIVAFLPRSA